MSKFTIPESIFSQLNEFSKGGFVLFLFNADGDPEFYLSTDDAQSSMALHSYIENWATAIREINTNKLIEGISSITDSPSGSDENDEIDNGSAF